MHIEFSGNNHDHLIPINKLIWKKSVKNTWYFIYTMLFMGSFTLVCGGILDPQQDSFWNGFTTIGLAFLGVALFILRQLYLTKKMFFERVNKNIKHKNSLGKEWKVLVADDHLASSDGEHDFEYLWSCFDTFSVFDESILISSSITQLAILVPKDKISEEQRKELLTFCENQLDKK